MLDKKEKMYTINDMRVNHKCPYNENHNNTGVVVGRYAVCPVCNKSAIVIIHTTVSGKTTAKLVKAGRKPAPDRREVCSIRLSQKNKRDVIDGKAKILPSGKTLVLLYTVSV